MFSPMRLYWWLYLIQHMYIHLTWRLSFPNLANLLPLVFERDPTLDPSTGCTNPNATANIKCSFWGIPIDATSATNKGQFRSSFEVAIAGSNGYVKNGYVELNPGTAPNYVGPSYLANAAINAPLDCNNQNSFLGSRTFNTGAFDERLCSAACDDTTAYNARHPPAYGAPLKCVFFNTYMLSKNGVPYQQQCAMYTQAWNNTYATNTGYTSGSNVYTIRYSSTYYNPSYPCHPICAVASPSLSSATAAVATSTVSSTLSTSTVTSSTTVAPYGTVASSWTTVDQSSATPFAPWSLQGGELSWMHGGLYSHILTRRDFCDAHHSQTPVYILYKLGYSAHK